MNCPKCNLKCNVTDTRHSSEETYRKQKCPNCGFVFYTVEFLCDDNDALKKTWASLYSDRAKRKEVK